MRCVIIRSSIRSKTLDSAPHTGRRRKNALDRIETLVPQLEAHLAKIAGADLENRDLPHWRGEALGWLLKIEGLVRHVGKKTSAEWRARIEVWRAAFEE